jgi:ABC-type cobalamin/Fe3+-siderophores transport system ATPase subunit
MADRGEGVLPEDFDDANEVRGDEVPNQLVAPPPKTDRPTPHLRWLRLDNFKRFESVTVDFVAFNVLAGPNNAGKSTILQAIDLFYSLIKVLREGEGFTGRSRYIPTTMLPVAIGSDIFYGQVQRRGNVPVEAMIRVRFTDDSEIAVGIRHLFGASNCRIVDIPNWGEDLFRSVLARPAVWVPGSVGIVRDEEYRTPARRAGLIGAGRNNEVLRNVLLELKRQRPERFDRLQRILAERFSAHVQDIAFDELTDQFLKATYASQAGLQHDLYSAGSGFVQILQLLTLVFSRDASVVLLDEPDAHLHSSMQRIVVEVLEGIAKEENLQIVLSTHSKEIINFVDPSRLIVVEPGSRVARPASDSVVTISALRAVGDIDNVDAFELVQNRRCLFVEGNEEKTVLGRLAATLGSSVFTGQGRVIAVGVGGANKFEHVEQLKVIESFLGKSIASLEIRDRDGLLDDLWEATAKEATRPLRIWWRDCLESYLVDPKVISRVVQELAKERGSDLIVSEDKISTVIEECSDSLRDETVDRVSARYIDVRWSRDKERSGVKEANEAAREAVLKDWGSLDGRLKWCSGKSLLGCIRERIQREYGVSFGNERLAEAFTPDEIPDEVKETLKAVEAIS